MQTSEMPRVEVRGDPNSSRQLALQHGRPAAVGSMVEVYPMHVPERLPMGIGNQSGRWGSQLDISGVFSISLPPGS